ncbi:MAG: ABC transporter permease [Nitratireductor sp.]|nr:ABC transporter permease [Nitratireductor sp.]
MMKLAILAKRFASQIPALVFLALLLLVWEVGVRQGWIKPYLFPAPSEIVDTFIGMLYEGFPPGLTLFSHIGATIPRVLQGFALAAIAAIPLGLIVGRFILLREATQPLVTFFRSIAVISLLPVALAVFGPGEKARIALIAYAAFWIIFTNTAEGARRIPRDLLRAGTALGASGVRLYLNVALPATLPKIFAGLKVALGVCWVVIVAVELIGTEAGVGALISNAQRLYRTDIVVVGMFVIGFIGYLLMVVLDAVEARLLPWAANANHVEGAR